MENKTISYLKSKVWYRALKVVLIGFILVCELIFIFVIIEDNRPQEVKDYKITCNGGSNIQKSYFANRDANIYLNQYVNDDVYQSLTNDDMGKIKALCGISEDEAKAATAKAIFYIETQEKNGVDSSAIQKHIDDDMRLYLISEASYIEGGYLSIILYALSSVIVVFVLLEVIKRIFYYIILGTFVPKK